MIIDAEGNHEEDDIGEVEGDHILEGDCSDDDGQDHLNFIQDHLGDPSHRHQLSIIRCALSLP